MEKLKTSDIFLTRKINYFPIHLNYLLKILHPIKISTAFELLKEKRDWMRRLNHLWPAKFIRATKNRSTRTGSFTKPETACKFSVLPFVLRFGVSFIIQFVPQLLLLPSISVFFFFAVRDSSFCRSSAVCLKGSSFIASLDCPSIAGHKLDFASLSKQVSRVFISLPYVEAKNLSSQKPKQKLDCLIVSSLVSQFSEPEKEAIVHRSSIARSKLHGLVCDLQILLYWIFKVSYWHWFMNSEVLLFSLSLSFRTSLFPVRKIIVNYFFSSG